MWLMCCTCNPISLYSATFTLFNMQLFKLLWYKREVLTIKCKEILTEMTLLTVSLYQAKIWL